jgi:hypothetical protein
VVQESATRVHPHLIPSLGRRRERLIEPISTSPYLGCWHGLIPQVFKCHVSETHSAEAPQYIGFISPAGFGRRFDSSFGLAIACSLRRPGTETFKPKQPRGVVTHVAMWQSTNVYFICSFAAIGKLESFFCSCHVVGGWTYSTECLKWI